MARSEKNLTAVFTDTASAIRAKTGTTETICPLDFADKINGIEMSGASIKDLLEAGAKFSKSNFTSIDDLIKYSDTENVTDFSFMFSECGNLTKAPNMNMSKATNMYGCFYLDDELTDAGDIVTAATNIRSVFSYCSKLTNIKLTGTCDNFRVTCYSLANDTTSLQTAELSVPLCEDFKEAFENSGVISANLGQLHKQAGTIHDGFNDMYNVSYVAAFRNCPNLEEVTLDIGSIISKSGVMVELSRAFSTPNSPSSRTTPLRINFLNADADVYRWFTSTFQNNTNIEILPAVNCTKARGFDTAFLGCTNLKELKFYNISSDINLSDCTKMTREALVEVINNLATIKPGTSKPTCTFGSTNLAKLTDEDKAIATNKGWALA